MTVNNGKVNFQSFSYNFYTILAVQFMNELVTCTPCFTLRIKFKGSNYVT